MTLIKTSEIGTGTEQAYQCQLTQAQLTPSAGAGGGGTDLVTFCGTYSTGAAAGGSTWTLDLAGFQAYEDATDLSIILFRDEGVDYTYELMPLGGTPSASNPGFTGEITLSATTIGGTAQQHATFTTSQQCKAKPTMVIA